MFGGNSTKLAVIITFNDGKQMRGQVPPGNTPGLMSAISNENVWLEVWVEGKRKFFLRSHMLCVEADEEGQAKLEADDAVAPAA